MSTRLRMYLYDMYRPVRVEIKSPRATRRKKILSGRGLCLGVGAPDGGVGEGVLSTAGLSAADLSVVLSGCGSFLAGTAVVCFLWIWARVTAQAGGL